MGSVDTNRWLVISEIIEAAETDPDVRRILKHGTPKDKLTFLEEKGLGLKELEELHIELEKIIYKGSIPWWWW
jgi:hypothetical protein